MCGRYYIGEAVEADELREIIDAVNRRTSDEEVKTSGEIRPADTVPIIASNRSMVSSVFPMKWGYTLKTDKGSKLVFNARSESAAGSSMFREGMERRRCIVPANNYFEWEHRGRDRIKYAIHPSGSAIMYMAGIYRMEQGRPVFSILTREPAESIRFIHDRMPVILPKGMIGDWINPKYTANDLLKEAITLIDYHKVDDGDPKDVQLSML